MLVKGWLQVLYISKETILFGRGQNIDEPQYVNLEKVYLNSFVLQLFQNLANLFRVTLDPDRI